MSGKKINNNTYSRKLMIAVNMLEKSCIRIENLRDSVSNGTITSVRIENALEKEWDAIDEVKTIVNGVVCDYMDGADQEKVR